MQPARSPQRRDFASKGLMPEFEKVCPGFSTQVTSGSPAQLSQLGTQVSTLQPKSPKTDDGWSPWSGDTCTQVYEKFWGVS